VSFAQLIKEKAKIVAKNGFMMITLNGRHTICVDTTWNLFKIVGLMPAHQHALATKTSETNSAEFNKWHQRIGHASAARIMAVVNEDIPKSPRTPAMRA
jgi:hypothetical protein